MNLKANMGSVDRIVRVAVAILVAILIFTGVIGGTLAWILGILGAIFLVTSFISFCPLYLPFNFSTRN